MLRALRLLALGTALAVPAEPPRSIVITAASQEHLEISWVKGNGNDCIFQVGSSDQVALGRSRLVGLGPFRCSVLFVMRCGRCKCGAAA